jgi:hypothetical protein
MAADDDETRAALARAGISTLGLGRLGVMRLGRTVRTIAERLASIEGKQTALEPSRRKGQQTTAEKMRNEAAAFAKRVDARLAKSDEVILNDAIEFVLRKTGVRKRSTRSKKLIVVAWSELTPSERVTARRNARKRYRFGKQVLEENRAVR